MEDVLSVVLARSRGEVGDEEVEKAIEGLLASESKKCVTVKQPPVTVQVDCDDYDDNNNNNNNNNTDNTNNNKNNTNNSDNTNNINNTDNTNNTNNTDNNTNNNNTNNKDNNTNNNNNADTSNKDAELLEMVPMGKVGEKMLVTFGDGPQPRPETVEAALLGARRCLQRNAVQDARALRRRHRAEYARAHRALHMGRRSAKLADPRAEGVDPTLLYRALQPKDRLASAPKCGFDTEQLSLLFPEEMNAYDQWTELHQAYEKNNEPSEQQQQKQDTAASVVGGHLRERAAHFDARTDRMKQEWYTQTFSEVRQGSFLGTAGRPKTSEKVAATAGRPKDGRWESLSFPARRFLHWIGFDPASELPPPNEETAHALAFLGYNFMGKIIEKAIHLRNKKRRKEQKNNDSLWSMFELGEKEQLDPEDIHAALGDSSVRPVSLYSGNKKTKTSLCATQLYFGPGFEQRLEMEMDELAGEASGSKRKRFFGQDVDEEEWAIRRKEDALFEKLAKPPTLPF